VGDHRRWYVAFLGLETQRPISRTHSIHLKKKQHKISLHTQRIQEKMIFLLLMLACAACVGEGPIDMTTLYFRERTLTKSHPPVPELVCKNTIPSDGCARQRIVFAECHKDAAHVWDAWVCQGHGDEHDKPSGLELHSLGIRCAGVAADTCSLTYTLRFNNATLKQMEREHRAQECLRLYESREFPFEDVVTHNLLRYGLTGVALGVIALLVAVLYVMVFTRAVGFPRRGLMTVQICPGDESDEESPALPAEEKREQ
jgi:hypothetical protein